MAKQSIADGCLARGKHTPTGRQPFNGNRQHITGNNNSQTSVIGNNNTIVFNSGVPIKHYFELCEAYRGQVDCVLELQRQNLILLEQNTALKNEVMRLKGLIEK